MKQIGVAIATIISPMRIYQLVKGRDQILGGQPTVKLA